MTLALNKSALLDGFPETRKKAIMFFKILSSLFRLPHTAHLLPTRPRKEALPYLKS